MEQVESIIQYIESCAQRRAGFSTFQMFYESQPQLHPTYPIIHIAGTNGKGSTLNDLRSVLQEAGYRVGTFTSPYLETHLDRIRINDQSIAPDAFVSIFHAYQEIMEKGELGSFEMDFVLALAYFNQQKCDIGIIEAGIGGRFDCTNVIMPCVSVITNIGKDHTTLLGETYEQIAWQKAGIAKPHVPFVIGEKKQNCKAVIQQECMQKQAPYFIVSTPEQVRIEPHQITFTYEGQEIVIPSGAQYQIDNAACALCTLQVLIHQKIINVTPKQIVEGMKKAIWLGRFEILQKEPLVIVDGAHNEEGIHALVDSIRDLPHVRILFAVLKDKDCDPMLETLCSISDDVTITAFPYARCADPHKIKKTHDVNIEEDYKKAIEDALQASDAPLVITGSLYFISLVRSYFKERQ